MWIDNMEYIKLDLAMIYIVIAGVFQIYGYYLGKKDTERKVIGILEKMGKRI